ncbi:hypothetical protein JTE90_021186 [Oedothorax gibbosus]|uniref:Uncharacterized protein n=1 Tax=Oedothorax gibbosus TaxID=931172 RepID=A0AAV6V4W2_9ARAC|nr:hypothetical protein JTE90_021186 [Oedothorax gibbosus]
MLGLKRCRTPVASVPRGRRSGTRFARCSTCHPPAASSLPKEPPLITIQLQKRICVRVCGGVGVARVISAVLMVGAPGDRVDQVVKRWNVAIIPRIGSVGSKGGIISIEHQMKDAVSIRNCTGRETAFLISTTNCVVFSTPVACHKGTPQTLSICWPFFAEQSLTREQSRADHCQSFCLPIHWNRKRSAPHTKTRAIEPSERLDWRHTATESL